MICTKASPDAVPLDARQPRQPVPATPAAQSYPPMR